MAVTLNEGATSLAAANWSNATGFADNAALVINKPVGGGASVTGSVDQSTLPEGIHSLDVQGDAQGTLGSATNPFKCDIDDESSGGAGDAADAYFACNGKQFTVYYVAAGDDNLCRNLTIGHRNTFYLNGGTATNVGVSGGSFFANQSAVVTNFDQYAGYSEIEYNATAITAARVMGGICIIKRLVTTLTVGHGARVIYDPDDLVTNFASTTINQYGGNLRQTRGATPTILSLAGTYDLSTLQEETTPGGTSWLVGGAEIRGNAYLDDSNATLLYGSKRDIGAPIAIP